MPLYQRFRVLLSSAPRLAGMVALGGLLLAATGLWVVERELSARTGEGLMLGAAIAGALLWARARLRREQRHSLQAQRALMESEARTRTILDHAMDAVIVMDAQGLILLWNKQAEAIFGWPAQEVLGQSLAGCIVPPQYREAHIQGLARYLATGTGAILNKRVEISAVRKDGTEFPIELTVTPVRTEHGTLFSAFVRDITARNQMIAQLNEREMFFRLLSEQLPVGVFEVDAAGACLYTNKMWKLICGGKGETAEARLPAEGPSGPWTQWFHPDDRPAIEQAWEQTTSSYWPIRHECRLAGGQDDGQWVQVLLWPMVTETGVRYLGTIEDITVRKRTIAHTMQLLQQGRFEFQTITEARNLGELLAYAFPDPARARLGVTELFVNGVEHGNLAISYDEKTRLLEQGVLDEELARRLALPEYAKRRVRVSMKRTDAELQLTIVDDGDGFEWKPYLELGGGPPDLLHGRGIAISKLISFDRLEYRGRGNHVVVTTRLAGRPAGEPPTEQVRAA